MMKRVCALVVLLGAIACGGARLRTVPTLTQANTAPTPTQANITLTPSPNPATATDCSPTPCQLPDGRLLRWRAGGTLTIQETAGISGNVNSITVTSFTPPLVYGSDAIVQRSGTNHVAARGMLIFPLNFLLGFVNNPNEGRPYVIPFVVQFTDDRGNQLTSTVQWSVN